MRPPQESPTRQAVSSATPNSSIRGAPSAITSAASSTTAPSTQPPDTEPRKFPSPSMTRWEPTGRGADPQVSTTVAIATSRPASRQDSAAAKTSSSLVIITMHLAVDRLGRHKPHLSVGTVTIWFSRRLPATTERRLLDTIDRAPGAGDDLDGTRDAQRAVRIGRDGKHAIALRERGACGRGRFAA